MDKTRQNVTLVVDEGLLLAARKVALDQRTSVNQLVREYLAALVEEPNRRRPARATLRKAFETGLVDAGAGSGAATISMTGDRASTWPIRTRSQLGRGWLSFRRSLASPRFGLFAFRCRPAIPDGGARTSPTFGTSSG